MKVLHVNEHQALKGGVETYLYALLPMLVAEGMQPQVLYGEGDAALWQASYQAPALGKAGFQYETAAAQQMETVLQKVQPDVIHIHNVQNIGTIRASLDYGKTVITAHDYRSVCPANMFFFKRTQEVCPRDKAGLGCFTTTLQKHCLTPRPQYAAYFFHRATWLTRNADRFAAIIAPSEGASERLQRAGFPTEKIQILPYFCSIEPLAAPRPVPRQTTITFIGRIAPNKGQEYFIEALGLLPDHVQGLMVGNIGETAQRELKELAKANHCDQRLRFQQWASREDIPRILDQTSVFIFPSLWEETLGIVGLEAMARGVPVVASDLGGVAQWLQNGANGFRVLPKSGQAIADKVLDILTSEERLLQFGKRGIALLREQFLPETHVEKLTGLYRQISN